MDLARAVPDRTAIAEEAVASAASRAFYAHAGAGAKRPAPLPAQPGNAGNFCSGCLDFHSL